MQAILDKLRQNTTSHFFYFENKALQNHTNIQIPIHFVRCSSRLAINLYLLSFKIIQISYRLLYNEEISVVTSSVTRNIMSLVKLRFRTSKYNKQLVLLILSSPRGPAKRQ